MQCVILHSTYKSDAFLGVLRASFHSSKGYLAFASIVVHKFESGKWKEVQGKYDFFHLSSYPVLMYNLINKGNTLGLTVYQLSRRYLVIIVKPITALIFGR